MILANGQRAGFFIGDGAGVGKGRQVIICFGMSKLNHLPQPLTPFCHGKY